MILMPIARNMEELEQQILNEMRKAMNETLAKSGSILIKETARFYTVGNPKIYERTYELGRTPRTTPVYQDGKTLMFEAYLDTDYQYKTGSRPYMEEVLSLANDGVQFPTKNYFPARPTLGKSKFWQRSEKEIQKTFIANMRQYFRKI